MCGRSRTVCSVWDTSAAAGLEGPDPTPAPGRGVQPRSRCGVAPAPPQECCALPPCPFPTSSSRKAALPTVSPNLEEGVWHFSAQQHRCPRNVARGGRLWPGEEGCAEEEALDSEELRVASWTALFWWYSGVDSHWTAPCLPVTRRRGVDCALCWLLQCHWVK